MALSSAVLFSNQDHLDPNERNNVINSCIGGVHDVNPFALIPQFNEYYIRSAYQTIIEQPDLSVDHFRTHSGFKFYLCKINNEVFEAVTSLDTTVIYRVIRVVF